MLSGHPLIVSKSAPPDSLDVLDYVVKQEEGFRSH